MRCTHESEMTSDFWVDSWPQGPRDGAYQWRSRSGCLKLVVLPKDS